MFQARLIGELNRMKVQRRIFKIKEFLLVYKLLDDRAYIGLVGGRLLLGFAIKGKHKELRNHGTGMRVLNRSLRDRSVQAIDIHIKPVAFIEAQP